MKIGILTFTYGDNYGQRLQNLAMQELLRDYFESVVTIPQVPYVVPLRRRIKRQIFSILQGEYYNQKLRNSAFERFDTEYIDYFNVSISERTMNTFPQNEFDYFVAGSDQIWSPYSPDVNSTMFLSFADKDKRIALSPSISSEGIPEEQKEKYKRYFEGFSFLSVREDKGAEIIKDLSGRDAAVLIDPTLMHGTSFWDKYIKEPKSMMNEKYALCYFLGTPQRAEKIDEICKKYNLNRIDILTEKEYKILGPQEFLYLIRNASVVITDSYHGCIFSCVFHVPFIMCEREGTNLNMNSRFTTLFKKLGISNRRLNEIEIENALCLNFASIDDRVEYERGLVRKYLDMAFNRARQEK